MANSRPFYDFLREHRNGKAHDELSDALQECVASVVEEGRTAKLTFTVTVKKSGAGEGAFIVMDEIKTSLPKPDKGGSIFFVTPDNNLIREDPRQRSLALTEVRSAPPVRELGSNQIIA